MVSLYAVVAIILVQGSHADQSGHFLSSLITAHSEFMQKAKNMSCEVTDLSSDKYYKGMTMEFHFLEGRELYIESRDPSRTDQPFNRLPVGHIACVNRSNAFRLRKTTSNKNWHIIDVGSDVSGVRDTYSVVLQQSLLAPTVILGKSLAEWKKDANCDIHITEASAESVSLMLSIKDLSTSRSSRGVVRCRRDVGWCVSDVELVVEFYDPNRKRNANGTMQYSITYDSTVDGVPMPSLVRHKYLTDIYDPMIHKWRIANVRRCTLSDADFSLGAYGFPDLTRPSESPRPWVIYAVVLGLLCFTAAWYLKYRRQISRRLRTAGG
jgi:hypothetical protein